MGQARGWQAEAPALTGLLALGWLDPVVALAREVESGPWAQAGEGPWADLPVRAVGGAEGARFCLMDQWDLVAVVVRDQWGWTSWMGRKVLTGVAQWVIEEWDEWAPALDGTTLGLVRTPWVL